MKEEEDAVVVVSSDSEEDESSVWIKKCKNKQFQNLWNKVQPILFHHVLPEYKSSYFPYEKFKELAEDMRKSLTLVYVDSTQAFIWKNCIRWLVSMKLCYEGISDLKYDERYNLILTDYMSQYLNYKCNLYSTITDETEVRRKVDEILVTLGIVFSGNIPSILMTLLKIEVKDVYRLILDPIFRKYLSNKSFHESNELISYLRLILCYRQWKRLFHFKEEKELINEIAVGKSDKFFRSRSQQMSIDLTAREAVLPKTVPKFNETNQSFAAISGLIRIAMEEPYGTRTLLIRKSLDLDETIVRYFQKYEKHICQSDTILCESTKALRIFDDVSNISRCTSPIPQPMVIQDLKRSPSRNESLMDVPTLTAEPECQRRTTKEAQQKGLNIVNNIDKQGTKAVNQHLSMDCDISRISNAFNFSNLSRNEQQLSLSIKKKIQNSSSDVKLGILSNNMGSVIELDTTDGEDDDIDDNIKNGNKNTTVVDDETQRSKTHSPSLRSSFLEKLQQRAVVIGSNCSRRRSRSPIVLSSSSDEDDVEPVVRVGRQVGNRNMSLLNRNTNQQRTGVEQNSVPEAVNRPLDERRKLRCITGEVSSTTSLDYSSNPDAENSAMSQIARLENAREVGTLSAVRTSPRCGSIVANNDYSDISDDEAGPSSLSTGRQVSGLLSKFSKVVEEATSSTSEMWVGGDVPSENVVFSLQPTRALRSTSSSPCITRTSSPIDNFTNNFPSSTIRLSRMRSGLIVQPQLASVSRITVRRLNSLTGAADEVSHSRSRERSAPIPLNGSNSIDRQKEIHENLNRSKCSLKTNIQQDDEVPTCSRYVAAASARVNSEESSRTDTQHSRLGTPKMTIDTSCEKEKETSTADREEPISLKPASHSAQNNANVVHPVIAKELPVDESDSLVDLDKFLNDISDHIGESSQPHEEQSSLSSSKKSITKSSDSENKETLSAEVSQEPKTVDTGQVKEANTSQQQLIELTVRHDDIQTNKVQKANECSNSSQLLEEVKVKNSVLKKSEQIDQNCPHLQEIIPKDPKELRKPLDVAKSLNPNFALSELPIVKSKVESNLYNLKEMENDLSEEKVNDTEETDIFSPTLIDEELSNQSDDIESPAYEPVGPETTNTDEDFLQVSSKVNAIQQNIISEIHDIHKIKETSLAQNIEHELEVIEHENENNKINQCPDQEDCLEDPKDQEQRDVDTTELNDEEIFEFYIACTCKHAESATNVSVDGSLGDSEFGKCSDYDDTQQIVLEDPITADPSTRLLNKEKHDASEGPVLETTLNVDEKSNCGSLPAAEVEPILGQSVGLSEISAAVERELSAQDQIPAESLVEQSSSYEENKCERDKVKESELKTVELERQIIEASINITNIVDQQTDNKEIESTKQLEVMPETNSTDKCVVVGEKIVLKSESVNERTSEANYDNIGVEEASSDIFKEKTQQETASKVEQERSEENVGKMDTCKVSMLGVTRSSKVSDERTPAEKGSDPEMLAVVEHSAHSSTENCIKLATDKEIIELNALDNEITDSTQMEKSVGAPLIDVQNGEPLNSAKDGCNSLDEPQSSVDVGENESTFVKTKNVLVVENDENKIVQNVGTSELIPMGYTKVLNKKTTQSKKEEAFVPKGDQAEMGKEYVEDREVLASKSQVEQQPNESENEIEISSIEAAEERNTENKSDKIETIEQTNDTKSTETNSSSELEANNTERSSASKTIIHKNIEELMSKNLHILNVVIETSSIEKEAHKNDKLNSSRTASLEGSAVVKEDLVDNNIGTDLAAGDKSKNASSNYNKVTSPSAETGESHDKSTDIKEAGPTSTTSIKSNHVDEPFTQLNSHDMEQELSTDPLNAPSSFEQFHAESQSVSSENIKKFESKENPCLYDSWSNEVEHLPLSSKLRKDEDILNEDDSNLSTQVQITEEDLGDPLLSFDSETCDDHSECQDNFDTLPPIGHEQHDGSKEITLLESVNRIEDQEVSEITSKECQSIAYNSYHEDCGTPVLDEKNAEDIESPTQPKIISLSVLKETSKLENQLISTEPPKILTFPNQIEPQTLCAVIPKVAVAASFEISDKTQICLITSNTQVSEEKSKSTLTPLIVCSAENEVNVTPTNTTSEFIEPSPKSKQATETDSVYQRTPLKIRMKRRISQCGDDFNLGSAEPIISISKIPTKSNYEEPIKNYFENTHPKFDQLNGNDPLDLVKRSERDSIVVDVSVHTPNKNTQVLNEEDQNLRYQESWFKKLGISKTTHKPFSKELLSPTVTQPCTSSFSAFAELPTSTSPNSPKDATVIGKNVGRRKKPRRVKKLTEKSDVVSDEMPLANLNCPIVPLTVNPHLEPNIALLQNQKIIQSSVDHLTEQTPTTEPAFNPEDIKAATILSDMLKKSNKTDECLLNEPPKRNKYKKNRKPKNKRETPTKFTRLTRSTSQLIEKPRISDTDSTLPSQKECREVKRSRKKKAIIPCTESIWQPEKTQEILRSITDQKIQNNEPLDEDSILSKREEFKKHLNFSSDSDDSGRLVIDLDERQNCKSKQKHKTKMTKNNRRNGPAKIGLEKKITELLHKANVKAGMKEEISPPVVKYDENILLSPHNAFKLTPEVDVFFSDTTHKESKQSANINFSSDHCASDDDVAQFYPIVQLTEDVPLTPKTTKRSRKRSTEIIRAQTVNKPEDIDSPSKFRSSSKSKLSAKRPIKPECQFEPKKNSDSAKVAPSQQSSLHERLTDKEMNKKAHDDTVRNSEPHQEVRSKQRLSFSIDVILGNEEEQPQLSNDESRSPHITMNKEMWLTTFSLQKNETVKELPTSKPKAYEMLKSSSDTCLNTRKNESSPRKMSTEQILLKDLKSSISPCEVIDAGQVRKRRKSLVTKKIITSNNTQKSDLQEKVCHDINVLKKQECPLKSRRKIMRSSMRIINDESAKDSEENEYISESDEKISKLISLAARKSENRLVEQRNQKSDHTEISKSISQQKLDMSRAVQSNKTPKLTTEHMKTKITASALAAHAADEYERSVGKGQCDTNEIIAKSENLIELTRKRKGITKNETVVQLNCKPSGNILAINEEPQHQLSNEGAKLDGNGILSSETTAMKIDSVKPFMFDAEEQIEIKSFREAKCYDGAILESETPSTSESLELVKTKSLEKLDQTDDVVDESCVAKLVLEKSDDTITIESQEQIKLKFPRKGKSDSTEVLATKVVSGKPDVTNTIDAQQRPEFKSTRKGKFDEKKVPKSETNVVKIVPEKAVESSQEKLELKTLGKGKRDTSEVLKSEISPEKTDLMNSSETHKVLDLKHECDATGILNLEIPDTKLVLDKPIAKCLIETQNPNKPKSIEKRKPNNTEIPHLEKPVVRPSGQPNIENTIDIEKLTLKSALKGNCDVSQSYKSEVSDANLASEKSDNECTMQPQEEVKLKSLGKGQSEVKASKSEESAVKFTSEKNIVEFREDVKSKSLGRGKREFTSEMPATAFVDIEVAKSETSAPEYDTGTKESSTIEKATSKTLGKGKITNSETPATAFVPEGEKDNITEINSSESPGLNHSGNLDAKSTINLQEKQNLKSIVKENLDATKIPESEIADAKLASEKADDISTMESQKQVKFESLTKGQSDVKVSISEDSAAKFNSEKTLDIVELREQTKSKSLGKGKREVTSEMPDTAFVSEKLDVISSIAEKENSKCGIRKRDHIEVSKSETSAIEYDMGINDTSNSEQAKSKTRGKEKRDSVSSKSEATAENLVSEQTDATSVVGSREQYKSTSIGKRNRDDPEISLTLDKEHDASSIKPQKRVKSKSLGKEKPNVAKVTLSNVSPGKLLLKKAENISTVDSREQVQSKSNDDTKKIASEKSNNKSIEQVKSQPSKKGKRLTNGGLKSEVSIKNLVSEKANNAVSIAPEEQLKFNSFEEVLRDKSIQIPESENSATKLAHGKQIVANIFESNETQTEFAEQIKLQTATCAIVASAAFEEKEQGTKSIGSIDCEALIREDTLSSNAVEYNSSERITSEHKEFIASNESEQYASSQLQSIVDKTSDSLGNTLNTGDLKGTKQPPAENEANKSLDTSLTCVGSLEKTKFTEEISDEIKPSVISSSFTNTGGEHVKTNSFDKEEPTQNNKQHENNETSFKSNSDKETNPEPFTVEKPTLKTNLDDLCNKNVVDILVEQETILDEKTQTSIDPKQVEFDGGADEAKDTTMIDLEEKSQLGVLKHVIAFNIFEENALEKVTDSVLCQKKSVEKSTSDVDRKVEEAGSSHSPLLHAAKNNQVFDSKGSQDLIDDEKSAFESNDTDEQLCKGKQIKSDIVATNILSIEHDSERIKQSQSIQHQNEDPCKSNIDSPMLTKTINSTAINIETSADIEKNSHTAKDLKTGNVTKLNAPKEESTSVNTILGTVRLDEQPHSVKGNNKTEVELNSLNIKDIIGKSRLMIKIRRFDLNILKTKDHSKTRKKIKKRSKKQTKRDKKQTSLVSKTEKPDDLTTSLGKSCHAEVCKTELTNKVKKSMIVEVSENNLAGECDSFEKLAKNHANQNKQADKSSETVNKTKIDTTFAIEDFEKTQRLEVLVTVEQTLDSSLIQTREPCEVFKIDSKTTQQSVSTLVPKGNTVMISKESSPVTETVEDKKKLKVKLVSETSGKNLTQSRSEAENTQQIKLAPIFEVTEDLKEHKLKDCDVESGISNSKSLSEQAVTNLNASKVSDAEKNTQINKCEDPATLLDVEETSSEDKVYPFKTDLTKQLIKNKRLSLEQVRSRLDTPTAIRKRRHSAEEFKFICNETPNKKIKVPPTTLTNSNEQLDLTKHQLERKRVSLDCNQSLENSSMVSPRKRRYSADMLEEKQHKKIKLTPLNLDVAKSQIDSNKEAENCPASLISTGIENKPKDEVEIVAEQLELSIKNILGNKLSESEVDSSHCGMSKIMLTNRLRGFDSVPDDIFAGNGDPSESVETKFYPAILKPEDLMLKATQEEEASCPDTQSGHKSCDSVGGNGADESGTENQSNTGNTEANSAPELELDTFPMTSISDINVIGNSSIFEDSCIPDFIVQNDCLKDVLDGIIDLSPFAGDRMISGSYGDEFDNDIPLYMLETPLIFLETDGMTNVNRFDVRCQASKRNAVTENFSTAKNEVSTDDEIDFENELFTYPGLVSIQSRENSATISEKNLTPCVTETQEKPAATIIETLFESKPVAQENASMFKKLNSLQILTEGPVADIPQNGVATYYVPPVEVSTEVGFESYDELLADNTQFFPSSDLKKNEKQEQLSEVKSIKETVDGNVAIPVVNVETSVTETAYNTEPTSCPVALSDIKVSSQEAHQMPILEIANIGLDATPSKNDATKKQEKNSTKKQEKEITKTSPVRQTKIDMLIAKAKSSTPTISVHADITSPPKLKTRPNRFWGKKNNKPKSPLPKISEIIIEEQVKPKSNVDGCSDTTGTIESTKHVETILDPDSNLPENKCTSVAQAISTNSSTNAIQEERSFPVNLERPNESKLNESSKNMPPKNMPQLDELLEEVPSAVPIKPLLTLKSDVTIKEQPSKKPRIEAVGKLSTDDVFDWLKRGSPVNTLMEKSKTSLKKSSSFETDETSSMDSSIQPLPAPTSPTSPDQNSMDRIPAPRTSNVSTSASESSPILSMPVLLTVPKEEESSSNQVEPISDCSKHIPEIKNISHVKAVPSSSKCDTPISVPVLSSVSTKSDRSHNDPKTKIEVSRNSSKSGNSENSIPPKVGVRLHSITKSNSSALKPITTPISTSSKHKHSEKNSTRISSPMEVYKTPSSSKIITKPSTPGVSFSPHVTNLPELNPFAIKPIPLSKSTSESQPQKPLKSILKSPSIPSSSRPIMDSPSPSQKSIKSTPSSKQLFAKLNSPSMSQKPSKSIPSPTKSSASKKEIIRDTYSPRLAKHIPTPPSAVSSSPAIVSKRTPKNPMPAPIAASSSRPSPTDHITTIASLTAEINALSERLQELPERAGTYVVHKERKFVLELHEQKLKKLEELKKLHLEEAARNRGSFSKSRSHSERQPSEKHADHRLAVHRSQRDQHKDKPKESRQAYVNKFWQLKNKSFENIDKSDHKVHTIEESKVLPSWEWKPASTEEIIADLKTSRRN